MKYRIEIGTLGLLVCLPVFAGNIANVTNTFSAGDPALASQVNENFTDLVTEVDDNASNLTTHETTDNAHHDRYTNTEALNAVSTAGVSAITNDLITTQFTSDYSNTGVSIPDNNPTGVVSTIAVPNVGVITSINISLDLSNSDVSTILVTLTDPNAASYTLYSGESTGTSLTGTWPDPNTFINGDISSWIGQNPTGNWSLKIVDSGFLNNTDDGQINSWGITLQGVSNSTATINGDLTVNGKVRTGNYGNNPAITPAKLIISRGGAATATNIYYNAPDGVNYTLSIPNSAVAVGNSHIYYSPTGTAGTGSALLFNLSGIPSFACTLLHYEDDLPESSANLIWATDGGNTSINATAWGNSSTPTFMLTNPTTPGQIPLVSYRSYAIICF